MAKFAQGVFNLKNPDKYLGKGMPRYRSSWEWTVMNMLDSNPAIDKWASESLRIPYVDPLTGKPTTYVPDFFVSYVDANSKRHVELWEIKPEAQAMREKVGRSVTNQAQYIKNMAKWEACKAYCQQQGFRFRVITEADIYHGTKKQKR